MAQPVSDDPFYDALVEDDPEELYDNAPCAYVSTKLDGTIIKVNATFLRWTGYSREQLVGQRRFQELLPAGDRIFFETHFAPLLTMQGHVREIAVELVCSSNQRLPVLINSVLKNDLGRERSIIRTAIFDATERRAYERELLSARRRAEESETRAVAVARTLQTTFLPPEIMPIPGLEVAGAYRPAGDGSLVGGDFYDVFERGPGTWGVVLGDVCGKGPSAAVVTALARYTVRAEALRTQKASEVLRRLHKALLRNNPDAFCTALLLTLNRSGKRLTLNVASGGHPLPLRVRSGGEIESLGRAGTILGMIDAATVIDSRTMLRPGDVVLLYTDGVLEARREGTFFGEERLRQIVTQARYLSAQRIADDVIAAALEFQGGDARDDMAVVAIKVPAEAE